jgi:hypothetical protein
MLSSLVPLGEGAAAGRAPGARAHLPLPPFSAFFAPLPASFDSDFDSDFDAGSDPDSVLGEVELSEGFVPAFEEGVLRL